MNEQKYSQDKVEHIVFSIFSGVKITLEIIGNHNKNTT